VIHIVDFGTTEDQQPFMVMELLEGESLGHRMHREPALELPEVVQIAALTLRGLAAVHDRGIIHRDLKPDNVFLTRDRAGAIFPKILDFGISRSTEPRSGRRSALTTRDGMIVGTPEYMSPEQARGIRTLDRRTDLYSMGCILYEALAGELPFDCENVGDLIIQIVTGTAPSVHERNPSVPRAISDVIAKAMARSPDDRYQDAMQMQQALLAVADALVDATLLQALSDAPPSFERGSTAPRVSSDRLRTLEFAIDAEPIADARSETALLTPTVDIPVHASEDEQLDVTLPPPRRRRNAAFSALMLCGAAAAAFALWQRDAPDASALDVAAHAHAIAPVKQPAAPAPSPTITIQLRSVPVDAAVSVDGMPAAGAVIELEREQRNRVIKVAAPGKAPWQVVHHASSDASYEVWLVDNDPPTRRASTASTQSARRNAGAVARRKTPRQPPSALRKLDF
jgi:serine/threonine-protein kinase